MPTSKFTYDGDEPRYYPELALSVSPGDVVDLDAAPDERFSPVVARTPSTSTTTSAAPAPAGTA